MSSRSAQPLCCSATCATPHSSPRRLRTRGSSQADALLTLCMLPAEETGAAGTGTSAGKATGGDGDGDGSIDPQRWHAWQRWLDELVEERRVVRVRRGERVDYVATERADMVRAALEGCEGHEPRFEIEPPEVRSLTEQLSGDSDAESAITEIVRGWTECSGPITAAGLGRTLGVPASRISVALARLEALHGDGMVGLSELDEARSTLREAESEVELAELQLELIRSLLAAWQAGG